MSRQHRYQSIPLKRRLKWLDNVPQHLATVRQWLCFKLVGPNEKGKYDKVPYYVDGGKRYGKQGTPEERDRLTPLAEAIERMRRGKVDGVGFAFIEGGPSAIDFDGADSVVRHARVITRTWSEVSVGGVGAHSFVMGDIKTNRKVKELGVEFFSSAGFVAVTGEPVVGCEDIPLRGKREFNKLVKKALNGHAHPVSTSVGDIRNIPTPYNDHEREKILDALKLFKCEKADYGEWLTVGQALHSAQPDIDGPTFALWLKWSQRDEARFIDEDDLAHRWKGFAGTRGITLATLYGYARDVRAKRARKQRAIDARDDSKGAKFGDVEEIEFGSSRIYIEGLIAEGLTLLTGQKKIAKKTFWVLQLSALASVGESFMGHVVTQPLRVLAYMLEEGTSVFDKHGKEVAPLDVVVERIKAMGLTDEARRGELRFKTSLPPLQDGGTEQIEKDAAENDLIVIDSRQMVMNEDADKERNVWRKDYQHLLPLREIARKHHCAIVVVNHSSKGSDAKDAIDAGAATGGIDAAVDGMIILQNPDKEDTDRIKMTLHHRRLPSTESELRWNFQTHLFESIGPWLGMGRTADVLGTLVSKTSKKTDPPLSSLQVSRLLFGSNAEKQRPNVSRILTRLKRDGLVMLVDDPEDGRVKLWRCTKSAILRDHNSE